MKKYYGIKCGLFIFLMPNYYYKKDMIIK